MTTVPPLLRAVDASRAFGPKGNRTQAVSHVDLEVRRGEVHVLMGLSGSGKSTLLRMFNRLIAPTGGRIEFAGRDLAELDTRELRDVRNRRINMVFQHFALLPHYSVRRNASYGLKLRGSTPAEREAATDEALAAVGLTAWADARPDELSGGMRQRVGLARALATGGEVLLMDEPFSALDPLIRADLQQQVSRLVRELGKTVVFVTHDLNEALLLGDTITLLESGRVAQSGTAREILQHPASDYVRRFVREVDRARVLTAGDVAVGLSSIPGGVPRASVPAEASLAHVARVLEGAGIVGVVAADGDVSGVIRAEDVLQAIAEPVQSAA